MNGKRFLSKLKRQTTYSLHKQCKSGLPIANDFKVLGIETSCDDTAAAIVNSNGEVLSNYIHSQHRIHEKFGGIVPSLAMESHQKTIKLAISEAISRAGLKDASEIDGIAVTKGPGLEICLRVGLQQAQELANTFNKPFVTVHHHEAHCLVARRLSQRLISPTDTSPPSSPSSLCQQKGLIAFPFLALLASGGHTSLLCCHGLGEHTLLGTTLDDAIGESFDKAARLLGINSGDVVGGAAIEKFAREGDASRYLSHLTVPMLKQNNCDFSYAGLKNAFRLLVSKVRRECGVDDNYNNAPAFSNEAILPENIITLPEQETRDLCAAFQSVAFAHLEDRLTRAIGYLHDIDSPIRSLVVVGGVAANQQLRVKLADIQTRANAELRLKGSSGLSPATKGWEVAFPPPALCTDNGVMVAWTGVELFQMGISHASQEGDVQPIPRWPIGIPLAEEEKLRFRKRTKSSLSRRSNSD